MQNNLQLLPLKHNITQLANVLDDTLVFASNIARVNSGGPNSLRSLIVQRHHFWFCMLCPAHR